MPAPPARTWTITTTSGYTTSGYLPGWAEEDPSHTGVPMTHLGAVLSDINHHAEFPGQHMPVTCTTDPGTDTVVLRGAIDCTPYSDDPEPRLPVVNIQLIDDYWITDLDPDQLTDIAARLRTQADLLDHDIHPQLTAARHDWTTHHTPST